MNLNKVMIIGNLTRDPETKNTPSGQSVSSFSVATNFIWKDQSGQKQERAEFHNVVAWRRLAEIVSQYLKKGSKVYIEGRLQTRDWTGTDGVKRYRTEIVAENMIMLDSKGTGQATGQPYGNNNPQTRNTQQEEPFINVEEPVFEEQSSNSDDEIKVENIPF